MVKQIPPGPRGHLLLGVVREFSEDTLGFMLRLPAYGDFVSYRFGPFMAYSANHPDLFHQILVTDADKFTKDRVTRNVLSEIVGNGLLLSDGDFWKRQRKLVQPAFHSRRIGAYADIIVNFTHDMHDRWHEGDVLSIDHEMVALTMRVISKTLFDADVSEEAREISEAVTEATWVINHRFNAIFPTPHWLPVKDNRIMGRSVKHLDAVIQRFIDERRVSGEDKGDLLSMLLMAHDEDTAESSRFGGQMTDKQVRDEAMTLFGAGHETTSNGLTWAMYLISQHPEVEAKLTAELDSVLCGRAPTLDDLPNLPYTDMIFKEALRLYPPAFAAVRETAEDMTLAGYPVQKGRLVMLNFFAVHRDPRFWDEPEHFNPERFSPENEKQIPRYAYLPFGAGPRVCVGNMFAMMEARLILATVFQHWRLSLAPGHIVEPQRVFTLRAKYGMKLVPHLRQPQPEPAADHKVAV
jgi:cytochrome P450